MGYSPRGHKELDTTEVIAHTHDKGKGELSKLKANDPAGFRKYWNQALEGSRVLCFSSLLFSLH